MPFLANHTQQEKKRATYLVLAAVRDKKDARSLLALACALARGEDGSVRVVTVSAANAPVPWLASLLAEEHAVPVDVVLRHGGKTEDILLAEIDKSQAEVLVLGWQGQPGKGRYTLGNTLDPVIQQAACDVVVLRKDYPVAARRVLIPTAGGPNAARAVEMLHRMLPQAEIVPLYVALRHLGSAEELIGHERLLAITKNLPPDVHVSPKVITAENPLAGILQEAAQGYDLLMVGAGAEGLIDRFIFGDLPQTILHRSPIPTLVVRRRLTNLRHLQRRVWLRLFDFMPQVDAEAKSTAYKSIQRGIRHDTDYSLTLALAAIFAALGLLLDSPEVIVGAMMVAPLMAAILGMGLNIVLGEPRNFWRALVMTLRGIIIAVMTGLAVGFIVPDAQITHEIMAFSHPSLLDLGIALTAGITAAYAVSRNNVSEAFAGVAVAAALTPPLANTGLMISMQRFDLAWGALLLFITNLIAIIASGALAFLWLGFRPRPGDMDPERKTLLQRGLGGVVALLILVTIPLTILTHESAVTARLQEDVETALQAEVTNLPGATLVEWQLGSEAANDETLQLNITLRVPTALKYADARKLQEEVARRLERPVALAIDMVPSTQLRAYVPPPPTPTAPPTPTGAPTATATSPPTATPTSTPRPTQTPSPTATPTVTPTPIATPWLMTVAEIAANGLRVRYSPGGLILERLPAGSTVTILERPVSVEDNTWYHIFSAEKHLAGWVSGEYLTSRE